MIDELFSQYRASELLKEHPLLKIKAYLTWFSHLLKFIKNYYKVLF